MRSVEKLADAMAWQNVEDGLPGCSGPDNGRPACPVRRLVALFCLTCANGMRDWQSSIVQPERRCRNQPIPASREISEPVDAVSRSGGSNMELSVALKPGKRLLTPKKTASKKLSSIPELRVACIGKGRAPETFDFGTLESAWEKTAKILGYEPKMAVL